MKLKKYKSQKSNDLNCKLKSYSALTGAFLLSAGSVHSQVIFTDIDPDTLIRSAAFDIDFDHDGVKDFGIIHLYSSLYHSKYAMINQGPNPAQVMAVWTTQWFSPNYYPINLPTGNPIGPGGPFHNAVGLLARFSPSSQGFVRLGLFRDTSGYLGVEFESNGNTYYGWVECAIDSAVDSIKIMGYAYESTPNHYIIAGAGKTIGIQEPPSAISTSSSFYPNPVRNGKTFIQIDAKQNADLKMEIINGMGQVLSSEDRKLSSGKNIIELNVNFLASGTYFVKLSDGEKAIFRKILISK